MITDQFAASLTNVLMTLALTNQEAAQLNNVAVLLLQTDEEEPALIASIFRTCLQLSRSQFRRTTFEEDQTENFQALIAQAEGCYTFENERSHFKVEELTLGSVVVPVVLLNPEGQQKISIDIAGVLHNFSVLNFLYPWQQRSRELSPTTIALSRLSEEVLMECIERADTAEEAFDLLQIVLKYQEHLFTSLGLLEEAKESLSKLEELEWVKFCHHHFLISAAPAA